MNETKKNKSYLKITLIIIALLLVVFVGGSTYAHINGKETLISPLLRHLGIDNNKYEENATQLTQEDKQENVTVKLKDGVLDDTTLIIGYEINIDKNNPDAWIEVEGNYKLNNMSVKPINNIMEKISDTKYVYYQIFDSNEIKLNDIKNATIESDIYRISEYTETEDINSASKEYGTVHELEIKLIEDVEIKNLVDSKTYEFPNAQEYEILENVKVSATELITGSYTNILKIKTDKTQYQGDSFEKYYKILNEQGEEIATYGEEEKQYDQIKYNDRIILQNINENSKINIEVYIRNGENTEFKKATTIPVDFSKMTEKTETTPVMGKQYQCDNYNFTYDENWTLKEKVTTDDVGPQSIYLGTLSLEIPSTTNSEYTSSIYVKIEDGNYTLNEYGEKIRKENTKSPSEYYEEIGSEEVKLKNIEGQQITSTISDGESVYIKQDTFAVQNGKVYRIIFFGEEKELNNLKNQINDFISNFECK